MYKLKIISSTVRPGRKGPILANWLGEVARQHGGFEVQVLDLGEVNLPMMNEPNHPSQKKYIHEHTRQWSATIDEADAFVFVTAEYDHNYPAPLRNALEYLVQEWAYKPAGMLSYGGISAGTRAANCLKADLPSLRMVPIADMVSVPMFTQFINEQGEFTPNEITQKAAATMLRELVRWAKGLAAIRADK
jgi:NAD(P)H-dependent FMN reductase